MSRGRKAFMPKTCVIDGCERDTVAKNLCMTHYRRLKRTGSTTKIFVNDGQCVAPDCTKRAKVMGMCQHHYAMNKRWGSFCGYGKAPSGSCGTKIYRIWINIVHRPERGPVDYLPWFDFETFYRDVGDPPHDDLYFVKKNPRRGFGPDNWEWHHNHCANRDHWRLK